MSTVNAKCVGSRNTGGGLGYTYELGTLLGIQCSLAPSAWYARMHCRKALCHTLPLGTLSSSWAADTTKKWFFSVLPHGVSFILQLFYASNANTLLHCLTGKQGSALMQFCTTSSSTLNLELACKRSITHSVISPRTMHLWR